MSRLRRRVYVVETWVNGDPIWTPWYVSRHKASCEREMSGARRAFDDVADPPKFRVTRYAPTKP